MQNAFSGDRRITIRTFHTLVMIDRGFRDSKTVVDLREVFDSFNRNISKPGGGPRVALDREFEFDVAPPHKTLITSKEELDKTIEELGGNGKNAVKDGDVVFFWSETHGLEDGDKATLTINSAPIDRAKLRQRLTFPDPVTKKPRVHLLVFITDSCRVTSASPALDKVTPNGTIWRSLYFGHGGVVDISSTATGQKAMSLGGESGFAVAFANTFNQLLYVKGSKELEAERRRSPGANPALFDSDENELVDWGEYMKQLGAEMKNVFDQQMRTYFTIGAAGGTSRLVDTDEFKALRESFESLDEQRRNELQKYYVTQSFSNESDPALRSELVEMIIQGAPRPQLNPSGTPETDGAGNTWHVNRPRRR